MKCLVSYVIIFLSLQCISAQLFYNRNCPLEQRPSLPNFDAIRYLGAWYENSRYNISGSQMDCAFMLNLPKATNVWDTVLLYKHLPSDATLQLGAQTRLSDIDADPALGKIIMTIFDYDGEGSYRVLGQHILATDYVNFAVVWSCTDVDLGQSYEYVWVLSRARSVSPDVQMSIDVAVNDFFLRSDLLLQTVQDEEVCVLQYP